MLPVHTPPSSSEQNLREGLLRLPCRLATLLLRRLVHACCILHVCLHSRSPGTKRSRNIQNISEKQDWTAAAVPLGAVRTWNQNGQANGHNRAGLWSPLTTQTHTDHVTEQNPPPFKSCFSADISKTLLNLPELSSVLITLTLKAFSSSCLSRGQSSVCSFTDLWGFTLETATGKICCQTGAGSFLTLLQNCGDE